MISCANCGTTGRHMTSECPQLSQPGRPPWCGECSNQTRLIDHGDYMQRCPRCWAWPAKGTYPHQELPQFKRCGGCGKRVYTWDSYPCGEHQPGRFLPEDVPQSTRMDENVPQALRR